MGRMIETATTLTPEHWTALDSRLKRVDEDRWLSSRYAAEFDRRRLVAVYAFNYELARVRSVVSEDMLGAIRFQWWRDALDEIAAGLTPRKHDVVHALVDTAWSPARLAPLIDGYEAAFERKDRNLEPEGLLMVLAAGALDPDAAGALEAILNTLGETYAAARRGAVEPHRCAVFQAPQALRPALAHAALRRSYATKGDVGPLKKRLAILGAFVSGRI